MLDSAPKVGLLQKRVKSCRLYLFKEEQKLSKLRWDLGTAQYKKHILLQEASHFTHGPPAGVSWITHGLRLKCGNFRKALLKEAEKLAKKRWELARYHTKLEALVAGAEIDK